MSDPSSPVRSSTPVRSSGRHGSIFTAMTQTTPLRAPVFHVRNTSNSSSPTRSHDDSETDLPPLVSRNATETIQRFATAQQLRPDQVADSIAVLRDPVSVVMAKIFVLLFAILNSITAIVLAQPSFELSDALMKNMKKYAIATMLSPRQASYKGKTPVNVLLNILKAHRFDLPPGIEHNAADYLTLKRAVRNIFTQLRSDIKKAIAKSLGYTYRHPRVKAPKSCDNIYNLTQSIVGSSDCVVTVELCARVALMRYIWVETYKDDTSKFWDEVDALLGEIREQAKGNQQQVARAFREVLKKDREMYGTNDYIIKDNAADRVQQEVDQAIDEAVMNSAGATGDDAEDDPMDGEGSGDGMA